MPRSMNETTRATTFNQHAKRLRHRVTATWVIFCSVGFLASCATTVPSSQTAESPRLVVLLIVDQLRGDYDRLYERALTEDGGLSQMRRNGTVFSSALYSHSSTRTAPGHATIVTGVNPHGHGIIANDWYDRAAKKRIISVQDDQESLVGGLADSQGVSPRRLLAPTVGDELILASDRSSQVISISAKDRGAILPGGHLGQAYWFNPDTGRFVTSSYYSMTALPEWVNAHNRTMAKQLPDSWALPADGWAYRYPDNREMENGGWGMGNTFPHPLPQAKTEDYFDALKRTPMMDEFTLELAQRAITNKELGLDDSPDFLVVSLSSTDYVNHSFGIYSTEAEANIRQLNRSLAEFIDFVETTVGKSNVTFVLTSDHGGDDIPEYRASLGAEGHRLIAPDMLNGANAHLSQHFSVSADLIKAFTVPNVYLDDQAITDSKLDRKAVLSEAVAYFENITGIRAVISESTKKYSPQLSSLVAQATHPARSGDMIILQTAETFLGYPGYAATHGSPDHHDRHVALMFYGARISARTVETSVDITAVAPTIARCLNVPSPADATGEALPEICTAMSGR